MMYDVEIFIMSEIIVFFYCCFLFSGLCPMAVLCVGCTSENINVLSSVSLIGMSRMPRSSLNVAGSC